MFFYVKKSWVYVLSFIIFLALKGFIGVVNLLISTIQQIVAKKKTIKTKTTLYFDKISGEKSG